MSVVEWGLQAVLVLALGACLPVAIRLERTLGALGKDREALSASTLAFARAVQEAEAAIAKLRQASDRAGRGVAEQAAQAERLAEDLRFLLQRAEAQADRLDGAVRAARAAPTQAEPVRAIAAPEAPRPPAAAPPAPDGPPPDADAAAARARAEEDLLRMMRGMPA